MLGRFGEVEDAAFGGDRADQALAHAQPRDVHRFLAQAVGREQLEIIVAQQVDRADLAVHRLGDEVDDAVEAGDVHRLLPEAVGREQLEDVVAQQIDRANVASHRLGDEIDDAVELDLRRPALGHDLVQTGQDLASGGGGGGGHRARAIRCGVGLSRATVVKSQMFRNRTAHSVMQRFAASRVESLPGS